MLRVAILRLLESYFRHRWLYLLPIVIAVAAGGAYTAVAPPEYAASGKLYVEKTNLLASLTSTASDGSWWVSPAQTTADEIAELIATDAFMRTVLKNTKLEQQIADSPDQVNNLFTSVRDVLKAYPRGEKLVEISATNKDPELAYQLVLSTMDAYVQWKINFDYRESVVAQSFFKGLIEPYKKELETARANLLAYLKERPAPLGVDRPPDEQIEIDRLQKEVDRAEERVQTAQNNEESAQLSLKKSESITSQTYVSIDQPEIPREAVLSIKNVIRNIAIFIAAGIFLSIVGVVLGALIDRSLRFSLDAHHSLGLRVLAMVPKAIIVPAVLPEPTVEVTPDQTESENTTAASADSSVLQPQV